MHHPRKFNPQSKIQREQRQVVIDEIDHAMTGIDLRRQLPQHGGHENHGQTGPQKQLLHRVGQPEVRVGRARQGRPAQIDDEDAENHHELPPREVSVHVVSQVDQLGVFVGDGMAVAVDEVVDDGGEAHEGGLLAFHDGQPEQGEEHDEEGEVGGHVAGELGGLAEDEGDDEDDGEEEEGERVEVLDAFEGRYFGVVLDGSGGGGAIFRGSIFGGVVGLLMGLVVGEGGQLGGSRVKRRRRGAGRFGGVWRIGSGWDAHLRTERSLLSVGL
mmetsp:Transcript_23934/g.50432  ORF Transcript_23934/g.50432 Transcript_23934/m.50432 type:complete len:271 (-) Transcript_23934:133-945(-)